MFFVGASTVFADLVAPTATEHFLFTLSLAVALFVSAPLGVFIDQDSFDESHLLSSFYSQTQRGIKSFGLASAEELRWATR